MKIVLLGAECTGKTTLAPALAAAIAEETGRSATWVPEWLRTWCDREGRTPRVDEQLGILREQRRRIDAAAAGHAVVVCDSAPLATAVYSRLLFGDTSLDDEAVAWHRGVALTLLSSVDLPWLADGLQRDGPQVRAPVDRLLEEALQTHKLAFARVGGCGGERLRSALAALRPLLATDPGNG